MGLDVAPQKFETIWYHGGSAEAPRPAQILHLGFKQHFDVLIPSLDKTAITLYGLLSNIGSASTSETTLYEHGLVHGSSRGPGVDRQCGGRPAHQNDNTSVATMDGHSPRQGLEERAATAFAGVMPAKLLTQMYREEWLDRAHGSLTFRLTQMLTDHGCF
ncbi:PREDICTED: uncharacterized protein LOC106750995 [Dinoponera quadriceps]|uniref:Uncharacterized protein LOC106750995 n=1 Tax=Dinoponera quadriceps TaxID=609295 RepID=A0A6P3Y8G3_DINQU|nr:PREDICTED: uncharacterized protein LOC106750995 [Dinoponera quadriceps]